MSLHASGAVLVARDLHLRFGAVSVLNGVDLTIGAHEALGIVGPNGAGKTSLLNVLAGAYQPARGEVHFRGQEISGFGAARRCRLGIGRSHQIPRPFSGMTVFENLMTAAMHGGGLSGQQANLRAMDALELCGMQGLANRRAETIGLLDRKRLEMARALATGPQLLLLDEIGGGLTDAEAAVLVDTIREIKRRQIAIVWIEHIVHVLLQVIDRLICMDAGKVIADGLPSVVLSDAHVMDAYLGGAAA